MPSWRPSTTSTDAARRLVSTLLFGAGDLTALPEQDLSWFIPLLRRNRVPVAVLPTAAALGAVDSSGALGRHLAREAERYDRQLAAYIEIAERWHHEAIEGILIKSPGYFPYTSSNVDVLVRTARANDACLLLEELGYAELRDIREPHKRLFRRMRTPHLGFPIHVHTAVAWINRFMKDDEAADGARRRDDLELVAYPSPDSVALIATAHWLYEDKELTLRDLYHASLATRDGADWSAICTRATNAGWGEGLAFALRLYLLAGQRFGAGDLVDALPAAHDQDGFLHRLADRAASKSFTPIRLPKALCKTLQLAKTVRDPELTHRATAEELSRVLYYMVRVKLSWAREPRPVVAISGPDGAGKTTLALALKEFFEHDAGMAASYTWIRIGSSDALEFLRSAGEPLVRRADRHPNGRGDDARPATPRRVLLGRRRRLTELWCYVLVADFVSRMWLQRVRCRFSGGVHLFDRFALDAAVDLEETYGFGNSHLPIALTPPPALQIVLAPSARDDAARESTSTRRLLDAARRYARYERKPGLLVEAGAPLAPTVEQAARRILELVAAR